MDSVIIVGFVVYYLLNVLLLENGGVAPSFFIRQKITVSHTDVLGNETAWSITWIDYLRRVLKVYEVGCVRETSESEPQKVWYTKGNQMSKLWGCPTCLGLWLSAIIVTLLIAFTNNQILSIISNDTILNTFFYLFIHVVSSAGAGVFLYTISSRED